MLGCLIVACGGAGAGSAVRPTDPTAADVLGKEKCGGVADEPQLLTLDWADTQRIDLERAMAKHVAVVHYDCAGLKVLHDCQADGSYDYAGVSAAKTIAKLKDEEQLSANLPIGAASMSSAIKRGETIDIVYLAVGQLGTTVNDVPRAQLKGQCDGATHTVRTANLGAFALTTGTHGDVNAAVELFSKGASAASDSTKEMDRADGELAACNAATEDATAPTPKCRAVVQLLLSPIAGANGKAEAQASRGDAKLGDPAKADEHKSLSTKPLRNPCNDGFRLAKDNVCTRADKADAYMCDAASFDECKTQCTKGDPRSCYNAAANRLDSKMNPDANKTGRQEAVSYLDKSCSLGYAPGCADLGYMTEWGYGTDRSAEKAEQLFTKACSMGDALACTFLGSAYMWGGNGFKKDQAQSRKYYERACSLGGDDSCREASRMYLEGIGGPKDPAVAAKLLQRSCGGGNDENCRRGLAVANSEGSLAGEGEKVSLKDDKRLASSTDVLPSPCRSTLRVDDKTMTCVKPEGAASYVCDATNIDECKAQCDKGNARSCWNAAANRLSKSNQNRGSSGREEAFPFFDKSCTAGYAPACTQFADAVFWGYGTASNKDRGKNLYQKACAMGDIPACTFMANQLAYGSNGWPKDVNKSVSLYEKACDLGATSACVEAANILVGSKMPKKNTKRALRDLDTACKAGDSSACNRANSIKSAAKK
jgi:TPR repeat protein